MSRRHRRAIAWFRRDLRVDDNRMLAAATAEADRVYPVFVVDTRILARNESAPRRVAWFAANVRSLDERLRREGSGLTILAGDAREALRPFAAEVGAEAVFAARDEEPVALARDDEVRRDLDLRLVDDQRLLPPGVLRTASGEAYRVFTPFNRALAVRLMEEGPTLVARAVADLRRLAPARDSARTPRFGGPDAVQGNPDAGEEAAAERLHRFASEELPRYRATRDRPDLDTTSRISPYLRTGTLSIRAAWREALAAEEAAIEARNDDAAASARRWRDELAWREFYAAILLAHPDVTARGFRPELAGIGWDDASEADRSLQAWRDGLTGYPIVDAGMRQLVATGWMHNRLRLITASFVVKDLGIDWRRGEAVFMEHLLDGDLAQNNGNWQWIAGVGTDAAPYFRILNPVLQARRFDPDGAYVRRWVPELAEVRGAAVHEPWRLPPGERPATYPDPMVDHAAARERALARFAAARQASRQESPRRILRRHPQRPAR